MFRRRDLVERCSEQNRIRENFGYRGTAITMATIGYLYMQYYTFCILLKLKRVSLN